MIDAPQPRHYFGSAAEALFADIPKKNPGPGRAGIRRMKKERERDLYEYRELLRNQRKAERAVADDFEDLNIDLEPRKLPKKLMQRLGLKTGRGRSSSSTRDDMYRPFAFKLGE